MKLKLFRAIGDSGIDEIERQVNAWLSAAYPRYKVIRSELHMCTISGCPRDEFYQYIVCSIWYETSKPAKDAAA